MTRTRLHFPYLLPRHAADGGTVITNLKHPNQNKYTSKELDITIENGKLLQTASENLKDVLARDQGAGLSVILSKIFKSKLATRDGSGSFVQTEKLITYQLNNSHETFQELCEETEFQIWFEDAVKLSNVYLVVGLQTITDANIDSMGYSGVEGEAGSKVDTGQGINIEASVHGHKIEAGGATFKAKDEQIWAIEYRKIIFSSIRGKEIDSALLSSKQVWKSYYKTRGDDEERYIHVDLVDVDLAKEEESFEILKSEDNLVTMVAPQDAEPDGGD